MHYAVGLLKKKHESTFSYEFVNDETTYVFPFLEKHGAMRIAEKCGGTVVNRAATSKDLLVLEEKNEEYIHREFEASL
ncbi:hypothetical protein [Bacillus toyonensis]|uniref:hypothetical protein n=1 Tax=Bacillus toyonensis TaxID=155322 RepID=UPI00301AFFA6